MCTCACGNGCSWLGTCCCDACPPCGCFTTTSSETCLNGVTYYYYSSSEMLYYSFHFSEVIFVPDGSSQSTNECIQQFMQEYYAVPSGYTFSKTAPSNLSDMTCENGSCTDQAQGCYMWQNNVSGNNNDDVFTCQCAGTITCTAPSNECVYG